MKHGRRDSDEEDDEGLDGAEHAAGGYAEEDDFDYEEYIEREFPGQQTGRRPVNWRKWIWRMVIVVVSLLLIWRFAFY